MANYVAWLAGAARGGDTKSHIVRPKPSGLRAVIASPTMSAGAGSWSLLGFEYQVDVSVWLALDLMVSSRLASEMVLEHVSEEDIEADVEDTEPAVVADSVPMHGYRLIVQAKRRSGDAWTETSYLALLNHGIKRKSAVTRLNEDPRARYLLVTSAALNGPVAKLGVRRAGSWPGASKVSKNIAKAGTNIAGRVAVIGTQDNERLETDIKTLLLESFRVPRADWQACLKALREAAWDRMLGQSSGRWTVKEVESVIEDHDGFLVRGTEQDDYVRPTNWGDLQAALTNRHAIVIIGQSGSGKTATAEALWLDRKAAIPDLKRVHITHGPDQLRRDKTPAPVFYDIEDPWGRFKFEPESRPWNDQLASFMQEASHDRLIVATSRSDVAHSSGAAASVERWRMPLEAENYGRAQLLALYRNLSKDLPADMAAFAHEWEPVVVKELSLPLELRKLFDAMPGLERTELARNPGLALSRAIEKAHRNSIEQTVIDQIEARGATKAAAIVWALIKPHGRLSRDVLRSLEDPIVDSDPELEDSIGQLVSSFVAARNLRQGSDGSISYYHGKVEAGFAAALVRQPQAVRRSLGLLVDALLVRDEEARGTWGVETAAQIIQQAGRIPDATPRLKRSSQDQIDTWVESRLAAEGRELERGINLAAVVGSARSNLSEFARWLEHRPDSSFPGFIRWGKPELDESLYARLRADGKVLAVADRFVRTVLATDQTHFPNSFAMSLGELCGDITPSFLGAAISTVGYGYIPNDDAIAAGALADLAGFEEVIDLAVSAIKPTESDLERYAADNLAILNAEVSEDYGEYLADDDSGHTARTYLKAYVDEVRAGGRWSALTGHRHSSTLREFWLRELAAEEKGEAAEGEIEAAAETALGSDDEPLAWTLLGKHWKPAFASSLVDRVARGSDNEYLRRTALECMLLRLPDALPDVVSQLQVEGAEARLVLFASDLASQAMKRQKKRSGSEIARDFIPRLPRPYDEVAQAAVAILEDKKPKLSTAGKAALLAIPGAAEEIRALRLRLATHLDLAVEEDVRIILSQSSDHDHALSAIDVAVRRGMESEINECLDHSFAHVAGVAITAIAAPLPAPLPSALLDLARRKASPVRKALVAQLKAKPHPDHLPALLVLAKDEWSRMARRQTDDADYPIACEAAEAILALESVPDETLSDLIQIAKKTEDTGLMSTLLACVVRHGSSARRAQVATMTIRGKRVVVGQAAAYALLAEANHVDVDTFEMITDAMVLTLPAMIASYLALLIGQVGSKGRIQLLANALAATDDRRIFLALLAAIVSERDQPAAASIAALLPAEHPARLWALDQSVVIEKSKLIDLGDTSSVKQAFVWMKPRKST